MYLLILRGFTLGLFARTAWPSCLHRLAFSPVLFGYFARIAGCSALIVRPSRLHEFAARGCPLSDRLQTNSRRDAVICLPGTRTALPRHTPAERSVCQRSMFLASLLPMKRRSLMVRGGEG